MSDRHRRGVVESLVDQSLWAAWAERCPTRMLVTAFCYGCVKVRRQNGDGTSAVGRERRRPPIRRHTHPLGRASAPRVAVIRSEDDGRGMLRI